MQDLNPITAVVHHDPYLYYAQLACRPGLTFDKSVGCWIASSAETITEVLGHPHCCVRPSAEPVPTTLVGSPAGEIYKNLIRMNDGEYHASLKRVLHSVLAVVETSAIQQRTRKYAEMLAHTHKIEHAEGLSLWIRELALYVVADLLGCGEEMLPQIVVWIDHFVGCLSPLSTAQQLAQSHLAAYELLRSFQEILVVGTPRVDSVAAQILQEAEITGWHNATPLIANLIGLLSQTYEATAGLIGNSIIALLRQPQLTERVSANPKDLDSFVQEVSRFDPSVHNTRRFIARPTIIADVALNPGESIILVLAAANRDPVVNINPNTFLVDRRTRHIFGFGYSAHQCPGQTIAYAIARVALKKLLHAPLAFPVLNTLHWVYRPSLNVRVPLFS